MGTRCDSGQTSLFWRSWQFSMWKGVFAPLLRLPRRPFRSSSSAAPPAASPHNQRPPRRLRRSCRHGLVPARRRQLGQLLVVVESSAAASRPPRSLQRSRRLLSRRQHRAPTTIRMTHRRLRPDLSSEMVCLIPTASPSPLLHDTFSFQTRCARACPPSPPLLLPSACCSPAFSCAASCDAHINGRSGSSDFACLPPLPRTPAHSGHRNGD